MANFINGDGLLVKLGLTEATDRIANYPQGGEYKSFGDVREDVIVVNLASLPAFGTTGILNDVMFLGAGAVVERVVLETTVAATGATATLSIGTRKNSDRTTDISTTALVNAVTVASLAAVGTQLTIVAGSTGAGGNIGVATTFDALFTATVGTANFTAGQVRIRIYWRPAV